MKKLIIGLMIVLSMSVFAESMGDFLDFAENYTKELEYFLVNVEIKTQDQYDVYMLVKGMKETLDNLVEKTNVSIGSNVDLELTPDQVFLKNGLIESRKKLNFQLKILFPDFEFKEFVVE